MIYTVHSHAKTGNKEGNNVPGCGVSVMSFQNKYSVGTKIEDTLVVGKRLKFVMNAGRMGGSGQAAYGGSFEATVRGRDYPMRSDKLSVIMTALSLNKELVWGGGLETEFRPKRGVRLSVNANLNTQKMGQISVRTSRLSALGDGFGRVFHNFQGHLSKKGTTTKPSTNWCTGDVGVKIKL